MTIKTIRPFLFALCAFAAPFTLATDRPGDEPLNPEAAAFYAVPPKGAGTSSAAIGLLGLTAPLGEDFMGYGRNIAARTYVDGLPAALNEVDKSRRLEIKWNEARMNCWTDDYEPLDKDPQCAPIEEAIQVLRDNREFLNRYKQVQKLEPASGLTLAAGARSFISATKLTLVEAKINLRQGRNEAAYHLWANQHAFLRRMASSGGNWVETAIVLVNEGLSLSFAESMLFDAPQLIDKNFDELSKLLAPESIARFNFPEMMRNEYAILKLFMNSAENRDHLYSNFITNRHYQYATEIMELAILPAGSLDERKAAGSKYRKQLEIFAQDEKFAASAEFIKPALHLLPFSLIKSMHSKNRSMNLLTIRLNVYKDKVSDADIPAYLASNAANLREPFNDSPMQWNPAKRLLFYENSKFGGALEARL